ncbi:prolyl oligopeptidase family serine peptidase [Calycomorphotria hydatis]|uniref:Alpha/beta hydrolase family protein n=1 Tax=Calycomorphotria hydatis TaxID=2528027 RepID=A0A517TB09_9PLAN|nr:prolyl oligopeptidase family serine peptidase [Calycomorphotria hydatis]QDT65556.1 Alpha/beta hydrolase family protein [Calycomorphotria hydatis]
MAIQTSCPGCGRNYNLRDAAAGKKISCKECGKPFRVPELTGPEDEAIDFADLPDESFAPRKKQKNPPKKISKKKNNLALRITLGVLGGGVLCVLICCGVISSYIKEFANDLAEAAKEHEKTHGSLSTLADFNEEVLAKPQFVASQFTTPLPPRTETPDLSLNGAGVDVFVYKTGITLPTLPLRGEQPGENMTFHVYRPQGEHPANSMPCVLVSPAGTPQFYGNAIEGLDYHAEVRPYAEAGMLGVFFSLDGPIDEDEANFAELEAAYLRFRAADGGLTNARRAIDLVLQNYPEVNPDQIFIAGHSSAAAVSLLAATHEPRIAGAIAYAPSMKVAERQMPSLRQVPQFLEALPDVEEFLKSVSPHKNWHLWHCPIFLFHATEDGVTEYPDSAALAAEAKAAGQDITFVKFEGGDHYYPMISHGIPAGIKWIQAQTGQGTFPQ